MPLVYQLNNHNSHWGVKPRYFGYGSKSSREWMFMGVKVPRHFHSRERKFQGARVPSMELSFLGVNVHNLELYRL